MLKKFLGSFLGKNLKVLLLEFHAKYSATFSLEKNFIYVESSKLYNLVI